MFISFNFYFTFNLFISTRNLKGLELWRCDQLRNGLSNIAESCQNLEELDIGWWYTDVFLVII
jgi:hypothetical protein